jgi:hypothetical protein
MQQYACLHTGTMLAHDRRIFQRLRLARPILGTFDDQSALVLDLGLTGAFVEHYGVTTSRQSCRLKFIWKGQSIEFRGDVARTLVVRVSGNDLVSHTGIRFTEPIGGSESVLQDLIATFVGTVLAAQKANKDGSHLASDHLTLMEIGGARRGRVRGLKRYRLQAGGMWSHESTSDREQPADGFTVAAYEYEEDLEALCRTYEIADDEGRRLIRLVAELSVQTVAPA